MRATRVQAFDSFVNERYLSFEMKGASQVLVGMFQLVEPRSRSSWGIVPLLGGRVRAGSWRWCLDLQTILAVLTVRVGWAETQLVRPQIITLDAGFDGPR